MNKEQDITLKELEKTANMFHDITTFRIKLLNQRFKEKIK